MTLSPRLLICWEVSASWADKAKPQTNDNTHPGSAQTGTLSKSCNTMNSSAPKNPLPAFLATLDALRLKREAEQRQERKDREDKKLAKLRPWWQDFAQ